ncbi:hypothetical protein [Saccharomonospora iraqiensis]|uniref:hypothetical protein n=1 Tax=Saccharomonospora iraqiensis TaxID=52698 RepID=UPI00022DECD4|nr:hypothetical protein [Saccharomonospora iraqiensis]
MIRRDRELLTRLATVNRALGGVVVELMARQDGGELPAEPLRNLAHALGTLATDLTTRADELDGRPINGVNQ